MEAMVKKILKIHDQMVADRVNWTDHWEDVLRYVAPHKNRIYNDTKGEKRGQRLYDTSAQHFVELLASALHSMLTNPTVKWFGLSTGDPKIDRKTKVKKYLKQLVDRVHDVLNNSNFQTEGHEFYMDIASLGTSAMFAEKDEDEVIRFLTTAIFDLYVKENHKGVVDTVSRVIKMSPENVIEKYGEEVFGKHLSELKSMKGDQKIEIVHMVMPRKDRDLKKKNKKNKAFASYHIYKKHHLMLKEDGYDKNPWIVARWTKLGNETYGRSPAMKTLPSIKLLNQMAKSVIRGAQKAIDPPMAITHDSILGRMNLAAGGVTAVRQGQEKGIFPIQNGARPELGVDIIEYYTNKVKQGFFIEQLQLGGSDRMTELEVNIRNDENLRLLSPVLGRLHNEYLEPLIGRILEIMIEQKSIPEDIPAELQDVQLKVFYRSQIAKAQTANEGRNISAFVGEIAQLSQLLQKPDVMDLVNIDEVVRIKGELDGIDVNIFNDLEDIEDQRESREGRNSEAQALNKQSIEAEIAAKEAQGQI